jgi:hypothetical protein
MYFRSYVCVLLLLCCVRYYLLDLMWFYLLGETFVTEFLLVPLSSAVLDSNSNNAFTASASIRWLLLFPSGGSDRSALICHFSFYNHLVREDRVTNLSNFLLFVIILPLL